MNNRITRWFHRFIGNSPIAKEIALLISRPIEQAQPVAQDDEQPVVYVATGRFAVLSIAMFPVCTG